MMRSIGTLLTLAALGIVGAGVLAASRPVAVYAPASDYVVSRAAGPDGQDRVRVTASVTKLLDCELERGDGPPWVDFYDSHGDVPPPSAFYRPDGSVAGRTLHGAGESYTLSGYSAVVPYRLRGLEGTFTIRVPCQLYTTGEDGERVYGRRVVADFGPFTVPPPGSTVSSTAGVIAFSWRER